MLEAEPRKPCFQVLDAVFEKGCVAMSGLDVCGKHNGRRAAKRSTHTAQLPLRTSERSVAAPFLSLKEENVFGIRNASAAAAGKGSHGLILVQRRAARPHNLHGLVAA